MAETTPIISLSAVPTRILQTNLNAGILLWFLESPRYAEHMGSALDTGFLNAAAISVSIFGTIGIVQAAITTFCVSIDHPIFPGPKLLKRLGLRPLGVSALLLPAGDRKQHILVAEQKLRHTLRNKKVRSVVVDLASPELWWWNIYLVLCAAILSSFSILPYAFLVRYSLPDPDPLQVCTALIFPTIRIVGAFLVAITTPLIQQIRLLEAAYFRLRFTGGDAYLKDHGKPQPTLWDTNKPSEAVLDDLRAFTCDLTTGPLGDIPPDTPVLDQDDKCKILRGTERRLRLTSFGFPFFGQEAPDASETGKLFSAPHKGVY